MLVNKGVQVDRLVEASITSDCPGMAERLKPNCWDWKPMARSEERRRRQRALVNAGPVKAMRVTRGLGVAKVEKARIRRHYARAPGDHVGLDGCPSNEIGGGVNDDSLSGDCVGVERESVGAEAECEIIGDDGWRRVGGVGDLGEPARIQVGGRAGVLGITPLQQVCSWANIKGQLLPIHFAGDGRLDGFVDLKLLPR